MVMEASGRRERKYCHRRGGGQRLTSTSRRLMERSTERFTTTGTNSKPPCCIPGIGDTRGHYLHLSHRLQASRGGRRSFPHGAMGAVTAADIHQTRQVHPQGFFTYGLEIGRAHV